MGLESLTQPSSNSYMNHVNVYLVKFVLCGFHTISQDRHLK